MSTLHYMPVAPPAEPQPEWNVYGFNDGNMLIVSKKSFLRTPDRNHVLCMQDWCSRRKEWKDNLKAAHEEVSPKRCTAQLGNICLSGFRHHQQDSNNWATYFTDTGAWRLCNICCHATSHD